MDYKLYIQNHYPYISDSDCEVTEMIIKEILIHNLYPYSFSQMSVEKKETVYSNYQGWLIRGINQIIERAGCTSAVGYTEGGFKISYDNADVISKSLLNQLNGKGEFA